jgi:hypothetical protein
MDKLISFTRDVVIELRQYLGNSLLTFVTKLLVIMSTLIFQESTFNSRNVIGKILVIIYLLSVSLHCLFHIFKVKWKKIFLGLTIAINIGLSISLSIEMLFSVYGNDTVFHENSLLIPLLCYSLDYIVSSYVLIKVSSGKIGDIARLEKIVNVEKEYNEIELIEDIKIKNDSESKGSNRNNLLSNDRLNRIVERMYKSQGHLHHITVQDSNRDNQYDQLVNLDDDSINIIQFDDNFEIRLVNLSTYKIHYHILIRIMKRWRKSSKLIELISLTSIIEIIIRQHESLMIKYLNQVSLVDGDENWCTHINSKIQYINRLLRYI